MASGKWAHPAEQRRLWRCSTRTRLGDEVLVACAVEENVWGRCLDLDALPELGEPCLTKMQDARPEDVFLLRGIARIGIDAWPVSRRWRVLPQHESALGHAAHTCRRPARSGKSKNAEAGGRKISPRRAAGKKPSSRARLNAPALPSIASCSATTSLASSFSFTHGSTHVSHSLAECLVSH